MTIWHPSTSGQPGGFLTLEDGSYLLLESGSRIITDSNSRPVSYYRQQARPKIPLVGAADVYDNHDLYDTHDPYDGLVYIDISNE